MKKTWELTVFFVLISLLIVLWFLFSKGKYSFEEKIAGNDESRFSEQQNKASKDANQNSSGTSEGWIKKTMEISGISFYYPNDWQMKQTKQKFADEEVEVIQLSSDDRIDITNIEQGYLCLDFRDYPKSESLTWSYRNTSRIKMKKNIMTKSGNIELLYFNDADSISNTVVSSHIVKGEREIVITISFNCVQSDGEYLNVKNIHFGDRAEVVTAEKILETLDFS